MKRQIKPNESVITVELGEPMMITASNKFSFEFLKEALEDCLDTETTFSEDGYVAVVRPLHGITNEDVIYSLYGGVEHYFFENDVNVQFKGLPKKLTKRLTLDMLAYIGKDIIRFISSLDNWGWFLVLFVGSLGFSLIPLLPVNIIDIMFAITWASSMVIVSLGVLTGLVAGLACVLD